MVELLGLGEPGEPKPRTRRRVTDLVFLEERFREAPLREICYRRSCQLASVVLCRGLGIGLHEYPLLMPGDETPLMPGMSMAIEPNYLVPEVEKYHVEDLVLVTEGRPRVLSRTADWSTLLEADV